MPRVHDHVVALAQGLTARERVDVVLGEEVRLEVVPCEPLQEGEVVPAIARWHATVEIRPVEDDRRVPSRVPGVAPPVAVAVVEVVRLPGVRRHDHGLPGASLDGGAKDERREPDSAVGRLEPSRVDPRGPVTRLHADGRWRRPLPGPVERDRGRHLDPCHLVVAPGSHRLVPAAQERQRQRRRIGHDRERHLLEREERAAPEGGLDSEDPHHRRDRAIRRQRTARPIDATLPVRADREPHDVGATWSLDVGLPLQLVRASREDVRLLPDNRGATLSCPDGGQGDPRTAIQRERHDRSIAGCDPGRDGCEERLVAAIPATAAPYPEPGCVWRPQPGRERRARDREDGEPGHDATDEPPPGDAPIHVGHGTASVRQNARSIR